VESYSGKRVGCTMFSYMHAGSTMITRICTATPA
jgi:hypothetical protein